MNAPTNLTEYLNGLRAAERRRATLSRMTGDEPAYLTIQADIKELESALSRYRQMHQNSMKKDLSRITSNY
jgi:hypothetical protein